jgi:hypothetical protein
MAIGKDEDKLSFTVTPRRSRRHPAEVITNLDLANDIALLSDSLNQAQNLISCIKQLNVNTTK